MSSFLPTVLQKVRPLPTTQRDRELIRSGPGKSTTTPPKLEGGGVQVGVVGGGMCV